jgi:hypothetical protein
VRWRDKETKITRKMYRRERDREREMKGEKERKWQPVYPYDFFSSNNSTQLIMYHSLNVHTNKKRRQHDKQTHNIRHNNTSQIQEPNT